jgi:hypothetical protein
MKKKPNFLAVIFEAINNTIEVLVFLAMIALFANALLL